VSNAWFFASPWTSDIENLHPVVLQETFEAVRCVPLTGVKVQARLVVLPGELDGLHGASPQDGIYGKQNSAVAISDVPFGSLKVRGRRGFFQRVRSRVDAC